MKVAIDLSEIAKGKITEDGFREKLEKIDLDSYKGKIVQLKGCAPTWAYLLMAWKLFGKVSGLEFLDYNGQSVPIYKESPQVETLVGLS